MVYCIVAMLTTVPSKIVFYTFKADTHKHTPISVVQATSNDYCNLNQ